jgi:UPF0042 nucleotide-binding protein
MKKQKRKVLIVTGLSGAGLSTTLKALEDLGYKAVDNLPLSMVRDLIAQKEGRNEAVAIGIDSRTWDFSAPRLLNKLELLRKDKNLQVQLVFVDCQDNVLQQRFTETRRVHPLAIDRPVADGVLFERQMMKSLKKNADLVIDTTDLKAYDLRRIVAGHFELEEGHGLLVFITSFGFRNGVPREADLVFDVRFLDNPHWDPKLRPLSGLDSAVARKVGKDAGYPVFFKKLTGLLEPLLPRYYREGKNYLTIAIGCTGGRHRSVFVAEELFKWLDKKGYSVACRHRDLSSWVARQGQTAKDIQKLKRRKK